MQLCASFWICTKKKTRIIEEYENKLCLIVMVNKRVLVNDNFHQIQQGSLYIWCVQFWIASTNLLRIIEYLKGLSGFFIFPHHYMDVPWWMCLIFIASKIHPWITMISIISLFLYLWASSPSDLDGFNKYCVLCH